MNSPNFPNFAQRVLTNALPVAAALLLAAALWQIIRERDAETSPRPVVQSVSLRVSEKRCAECHAGVTESFASAPHANTLTSAADERNRGLFDGQSFRSEITGADFHYRMDKERLVISSPAYARELFAEWIFGSGAHVKTPLITWTDPNGEISGIEHSVSWYPQAGLGTTLGLEKLSDVHGILAMGNPRPGQEVTGCFGCHSTFVPIEDGRINPHKLEPGVGCVRCHWNASDHVREMDSGLPTTVERLADLTPLESVNRCGECHRRADELSGEIKEDDRTLVRFASVGLVQSKCFLSQDRVTTEDGQAVRLDCISCHDPHRAATHDWKTHAAVCLKCHSDSRQELVQCSVAESTSNCLDCHMPKRPSNPHLSFTDHWIRIHTDLKPVQSP